MKITWENKTVCQKAKYAQSFGERLLGLMFSSEMKGFDGLLIDPCRSIHTFFMRYPIDVVFLSRRDEVVHIVRSMRPWRMSSFYWRAVKVLELPAGQLPGGVKAGMRLEIDV